MRAKHGEQLRSCGLIRGAEVAIRGALARGAQCGLQIQVAETERPAESASCSTRSGQRDSRESAPLLASGPPQSLRAGSLEGTSPAPKSPGVVGLTRTAALEYINHGIRVMRLIPA